MFSCLITGLHWYKIGHKKQINKVLFPCVDMLINSVLARRAQINNMLNNLNFKVMIKTYYKSEYTEKQWVSLIDQALRLRCKISYSIYGNTCVIDSTETETRLLAFTHDTNDTNHRRMWAEHLHERIRGAAM